MKGGWGEVGNFHTQSDPATGGRGKGEGIILIFTEAILLRQILIPNHLSASITYIALSDKKKGSFLHLLISITNLGMV